MSARVLLMIEILPDLIFQNLKNYGSIVHMVSCRIHLINCFLGAAVLGGFCLRLGLPGQRLPALRAMGVVTSSPEGPRTQKEGIYIKPYL